MKAFIESLLPRKLYRALVVPYHLVWAFVSALYYGFPARRLTVIGVTGTKGKSSVAEMITAILQEAGHTVALSSTIRFNIAESSRPNLFKMTLPGRGFIQKFLADALQEKCSYAVIELTSESALQYRHLFLDLNALVFTNLAKEHLESHGGMENYFKAKYRIGEALARSPKRPRAIITNCDNPYGKRFLELAVEKKIPFSLGEAKNCTETERGIAFTYEGELFSVPHPGTFSALNALAAIKTVAFFDVSLTCAKSALEKLTHIPGRAERVECGQDFLAIVDYAHTPDSLSALYEAFGTKRKICVLGNTGGGRDAWKRPDMGRIAHLACDEVILTNEDPYDEDPRAILDAMARGMSQNPRIILDRREAIRTALALAKKGDAVLITGKGTDPYIMGPKGEKTPWSDAKVVKEELELLRHRLVS